MTISTRLLGLIMTAALLVGGPAVAEDLPLPDAGDMNPSELSLPSYDGGGTSSMPGDESSEGSMLTGQGPVDIDAFRECDSFDAGPNDWWGDPVAQADVWKAHDPVNIANGLNGAALYVSYGDGTPGPFDGGSISPDDPEAWLALQNATFLERLADLQLPVTVDAYGPGSHDWPYWERALHRALPLLLMALGE